MWLLSQRECRQSGAQSTAKSHAKTDTRLTQTRCKQEGSMLALSHTIVECFVTQRQLASLHEKGTSGRG